MLELQHICYDVEQDGEDKGILRDIDLTIDERFVAITGPNGGGKSTLAKHFNSILLPTGGRVYVDGMDTADEELLLAIRRTVGMVSALPFSSRCASRV